MFDVHCIDREEENAGRFDDAGALDVVVEPVVADAMVDDVAVNDYARNTPVDGRARFAPLPDHRLTDRGRAIAGGNS